MSQVVAEVASQRIAKFAGEIANLTPSSFFIKTSVPLLFGERARRRWEDLVNLRRPRRG